MKPSRYTARFTQTFKRCEQNYPHYAKRLPVLRERILGNPYQNSYALGKKFGKDLTGKRARHFTDNFVVVFEVLEHEKVVVFHAFGTHKAVYGA